MKKLITISFLFTCLLVQAQEGTSIPQVSTGTGSGGEVTGLSYDGNSLTLTQTTGGSQSVAIDAAEINLDPADDLNGDGTNESTVQEAVTAFKIYGTFDRHSDADLAVPLYGWYRLSIENFNGHSRYAIYQRLP